MASRSGVPITGNVLVRESVEAPLRDAPEKGVAMDAKVRERLERWMETEGGVLGEEVIRIMTNATRTERHVRIWSSQTEVSCPGRTRTDKGREGMAGTYADGPPVPIRLGVLGIGDVAITSVDAEVYNLIGQRMKRQSPMANTVVVTLANGTAPSGYIPDDASFSHNTFQALGSRLKVGCAGRLHCRRPDENGHRLCSSRALSKFVRSQHPTPQKGGDGKLSPYRRPWVPHISL